LDYAGGFAVIALLVTFLEPLLAMTVNEELAKVEGYPVESHSFIAYVCWWLW